MVEVGSLCLEAWVQQSITAGRWHSDVNTKWELTECTLATAVHHLTKSSNKEVRGKWGYTERGKSKLAVCQFQAKHLLVLRVTDTLYLLQLLIGRNSL